MIDYKNPWVIGGAALLLVVLVIAGRSGSSSGDPASAGIASQSVATSANVQLAALTTQLAGLQTTVAGQVNVADTEQQTSQLGIVMGWLTNQGNNMIAAKNIDAAVHISDSNNNTAFRVNSDNNRTYAEVAPTLAKINSDSMVALAQIKAGTDAYGISQTRATNADNNASNTMNSFLGLLGGSGGSGGSGSPIGKILGAFGL